jgi:hypothetical protein
MAMQNMFESDLAEAEGMDDEADGFEDELDEADMSAEDPLSDEADDGFEDDSFEDDGFEDDDALDDDSLEAEGLDADGFEDDGFEDDALDAADEDELDDMDELDEGDEGDEMDALDDTFAQAMDAYDDDEFARRLSSRFTRLRRIARPFLRKMARRAVPIGLRLIKYVARQGAGGGPARLDAMDAFADAAADEAVRGRSADAYIPFLAGLAGRYVTKAILAASKRGARPGQARALGRAVTKATRKAAKKLVRKRGPGALRSVPRIVRKVAQVARKRPGSARAIPGMIQRAASRVASSPRAAAQLSRPNRVVRRVRARAGVGPSMDMGAPTGGSRRRRRADMELRRAI